MLTKVNFDNKQEAQKLIPRYSHSVLTVFYVFSCIIFVLNIIITTNKSKFFKRMSFYGLMDALEFATQTKMVKLSSRCCVF